MLAMSSGRSFREVKGVIESLLQVLQISQPLEATHVDSEFLQSDERCRLDLGGERFGFLGAVSKAGRKQLGLRQPTIVAELKLSMLTSLCHLVPQHQPLSPYPSIDYDFNFIVAESVPWDQLAATVTQAAGELLEAIHYQETYRDPEKDGAGRKRQLLSVRLRSLTETLTGEQAESVRRAIITACEARHGAKLL